MPTAVPSTAFSAIYDEHFGFVWAVLRRLGVDDADLDDVVQEVFIVVHRRMHAFEGRASVRTWLYAIAVRVFWNHARRRRNQPAIAETSSSKLTAIDGDPERFAARREAGRVLDSLLGKLDPAKRTVFVLAELEGLTAPQIAEITGANQRTVYSRLRAARSSFAAGLARVQARERNDALVGARQLARDDRPPTGAQQRTWAVLMLRIAAEPFVPFAVGVAATLKAVTTSIGLGVAALGVVYAATIPVRAKEPPTVASTRDDTAAERFPADRHEPDRGSSLRGSPAVPGSAIAATEPTASLAASSAVAPPRPASSSREHEASAPSSSTASPSEAAITSSSPADAVTEELALMQRARAAMRAGDAEGALRSLDEHAARFPTGKLAPERDRSRVTALCRAGRPEDADALARTRALRTPACEPKSNP